MAIGELNCPSLDYVYRMTWAEFTLRLFSYKRQERNDWYKVREVCYQIYTSNWGDPKRKPVSKEKYLPLDYNKSNKMSEAMRERILEAKAQYLKDKQNGREIIS